MTRLVLDTNVWVSAILNPRGKPAFILKLALRGVVELVISRAIIEEMNKVLHYPKLIKLLKKNRISVEEIEAFIKNIDTMAEITKGELVLDVRKSCYKQMLVDFNLSCFRCLLTESTPSTIYPIYVMCLQIALIHPVKDL